MQIINLYPKNRLISSNSSLRVFSVEELRKATNNYDQCQCIMWKVKSTTQKKMDFLLWKTLHLELLKTLWWDHK